MEFNEFQQKSKRTLNNDLGFASELTNYSLGLIGESSEVSEHTKKVVFHGHTLNKDKIKEELGDVLFYVSAIATITGIDLNEIAIHNIEKLKERYPDGFDTNRSVNRND